MDNTNHDEALRFSRGKTSLAVCQVFAARPETFRSAAECPKLPFSLSHTGVEFVASHLQAGDPPQIQSD